jgi:hypothetical protein
MFHKKRKAGVGGILNALCDKVLEIKLEVARRAMSTEIQRKIQNNVLL